MLTSALISLSLNFLVCSNSNNIPWTHNMIAELQEIIHLLLLGVLLHMPRIIYAAFCLLKINHFDFFLIQSQQFLPWNNFEEFCLERSTISVIPLTFFKYTEKKVGNIHNILLRVFSFFKKRGKTLTYIYIYVVFVLEKSNISRKRRQRKIKRLIVFSSGWWDSGCFLW